MASKNQSNALGESQPTVEPYQKKQYKAKKRLTIPLFSLSHTPFMMVKVLEPMYLAEMSIGDLTDKDKKPTVCLVLNLDTESEGLLICNEIVKSSFERVEGGYVGQVFQLRAGDIRENKKYRDIDIVLMEEDK